MRLFESILTLNDCYKAGRTIIPKGIMVHSTGANNPWLKRYVPDDGQLGYNQYNNHWNMSGVGACVHGFIGKMADGTIATYQTLPWNWRGWHSASGKKGSANNTHISFEICEDGLTDATYFRAVFNEAAELCAYLCKMYNLNPLTDIICHSEGHTMGIASNHGDVMHWFPKHGENMDTFRQKVYELVNEEFKWNESKVDYVGTVSVKNDVLNIRKQPRVGASRDRIIDFATKVSDEKSMVSREEFNRIFKVHKKYEDFLDERNLTNGEVDIAYRIITDSYEGHMRNHTFVEDVRGYNEN